MRRPQTISALLAAICLAVSAAPAAQAAVHWANMRSVAVTVVNGSLPPPYGRPHVKRFVTARELKRVTAALNANGIAARAPVPSRGCVGGYDVRIAIVRTSGKTVRLSGYRCAAQSFGGIAGNVPRFLSAVGLSAP
jgi:hypothetical protein